ncbi:MAG: ATP-binding cassette domain-containing protein [Desulfobacteraceae bacterium]|nr:ATP-binding cassette domain-containing protein [Desulfobacteraceae bacterium]
MPNLHAITLCKCVVHCVIVPDVKFKQNGLGHKPMGTREPFITLEDVTLRVGGKWLLPGTNWRISQGENWIVLGPNGVGKTTLANALMGQTAVVKGRIHRHYESSGQDRGHRIAVSMAGSEQYHRLYAREQFNLDARHFSGKVDDQTLVADLMGSLLNTRDNTCNNIINALELTSLLTKPVDALSSGEMRRFLLGKAMLEKPLLLILDEPFNGLDAAGRSTLTGLFDSLADTGTQMMLITHRLEEIPFCFKHVLHLNHGRVHWKGLLHDFSGSIVQPISSTIPAVEQPGEFPFLGDNRLSEEDHPDPHILIRMNAVTVRYGEKVVLDGLDWTVRTGEHWAVCGPNGAGKTTLLKLINGDHPQAYANDIRLFGRKKGTGESIWDIKADIGYLSDEFQARYQKRMTGVDVICSGFFDSVGLYRRCTPAQLEIAHHWIETLALEAFADRPYRQLSFGRQRLILIARAMVKSPRLLILDEPCNGLDDIHRQRLLNTIDVIGQHTRTSLITVCHKAGDMPKCITHRLQLSAGLPMSYVDRFNHSAEPP